MDSVFRILLDYEESRKLRLKNSPFYGLITFWKEDLFFRSTFVLSLAFLIALLVQLSLKDENQIIRQITIWGLGVFITGFVYRIIYLYLSEKSIDTTNNNIKVELEKIRQQRLTISNKEKENLLQEIKSNINDELKKEFEEKSLPEIKIKQKVEELNEYLRESRNRLVQEISSLNSKANVNLSIAVVTTILVVGFLIYSSLTIEGGFANWFEFVSYYIPRLTLVIFIELFSYYFLILYKSSLGEIKFYQNELTNIEFKTLSLRIALMNGDEEMLKSMITELLKIERNQIIKKDETTISLEKHKIDNELNRFFVQSIPNLDKFKEFIYSQEKKENDA